MNALSRIAAAVLGATVVYVGMFVLVFLEGSSALALAWTPACGAAAVIVLVLLSGSWRGSIRQRVARGSVAALLVAVMVGLAAWLSGWLSATPQPTPAAAAVTDGYVATRGGSTFFHQSDLVGSERPVLLVLHGGPGSGSLQLRASIGDRLDASFRTIYFDQRGVGRSSAGSSFKIEDYLDDMEQLRTALRVESWYLFGVSWGAALANEYTVRHPTRVRGIVTWGGLVANQPVTRSMIGALKAYYASSGDRRGVDWCTSLEGQTFPYSRLQTVRVMNAINRSRLKTILSQDDETHLVVAARDRAVRQWGYAANETETGLWATAATFMEARLEAYDFRPRLQEIRAPYLVLIGDHDPLLKSAGVEDDAQRMPGATVKRVAGSGHTLNQPQTIATAIVDFVRAQASGGAEGQ